MEESDQEDQAASSSNQELARRLRQCTLNEPGPSTSAASSSTAKPQKPFPTARKRHKMKNKVETEKQSLAIRELKRNWCYPVNIDPDRSVIIIIILY